MKCTYDFEQYDDNIMAHECGNHTFLSLISYLSSQMPSFSWFNLKNIVLCWLRDCEWMRCNAIIYHWAEWSVSLVSLSATSLRTMTLCPSHPPPNQMQFCCFYSQLEHLSLSHPPFSSVWPEQHARSSHDTLRGLFGRTQARERELEAAETKKHLAVLMHFV